MSPRKKPKLVAETRRALQMTAAVVRESIMHVHVARALNLIELVGARIPVMRTLDIYTRVHDLSKADADVLSNRLLALLGRRAPKGHPPLVYAEGEADRAINHSIAGVLRQRLRGRKLYDVRRLVEIHTGATRAAVLEIHVRHALRFVKDLADTHLIPDALEVYLEIVGVPDYMSDALYIFVLDALAEEELPRVAETGVGESPRRQPIQLTARTQRVNGKGAKG